jgi:hypothetical protein
MKRDSRGYQTAKGCIIGKHGSFAGWILTGPEFQTFTLENKSANEVQAEDY